MHDDDDDEDKAPGGGIIDDTLATGPPPAADYDITEATPPTTTPAPSLAVPEKPATNYRNTQQSTRTMAKWSSQRRSQTGIHVKLQLSIESVAIT